MVFETDSPYNHVIVADDGTGLRSLYFEKNGAIQSRVKLGEPLALQLPYTRAAMLGLALVEAPKRILIIGLGGGAMPMFLRRVCPRARIDVVDIDPAVADAARRFFDVVEDDRLRIHVADGRAFVAHAADRFDLVFLDAFGAGAIPRHLATREFLESVKAHLAPGGAVVGNVWAQDFNPLYPAMAATYRAAFGGLCPVAVSGTSNRIFLAQGGLPGAGALAERAARAGESLKLPFPLEELAAGGCLDDGPPDIAILSDSDR